MEKITIEGKTGLSHILVGEHFQRLKEYIPQEGVYLITDANLARHYGTIFPDFPLFVVEPGEGAKDFQVMIKIYHWLLDKGADRNSFVVGVGGGVVCDLAGFVASTFMRGIRFGFVASSLLAQVDASVGGKNGVNLGGYKNIVGTFTQPEFVICDTAMLATLPHTEFRNGMAEVIKHALIRDAAKFNFLEKNPTLLLNGDKKSIDYIVKRSVQIKAEVVQNDEMEQGQRRLLNFGHTWGHALEKVLQLPHGQAVSLGMVFAANFSQKLGLLSHEKTERITQLLLRYQLPVAIEYDKQQVFDAMLKDKKKYQTKLHFVLLRDIGNSFVKEVDVAEIKTFAGL